MGFISRIATLFGLVLLAHAYVHLPIINPGATPPQMAIAVS